MLSTEPKAKVQSESSDHHSRADSQSFVMNLFLGEGRVGQQFPFPKVLNEEEIQMVDMITEPVTRATKDLIDPLRFDQNEQFDDKLWNTLKELGSFGTSIPPEYGGAGLKASQFALLSQVLGSQDLSLCIALGAHQSIGLKGIIMFGTEEQKQKYLPDLATGKKITCFCLTEPSAGN